MFYLQISFIYIIVYGYLTPICEFVCLLYVWW